MFIHIDAVNQILYLFLIYIYTMKDPVTLLYETYPFDAEKILASACGEAYVAVMLASGRIGVCSTLGKPIETDPLVLTSPDLKNRDHRMLVTAYANAHINYEIENPIPGDIFEQVDFASKKSTVMIGYFPPLVEKFRKDGITLFSFDQLKDYPDLTPQSQLEEKLSKADCVIISATALINSTFTEIINQVKPGSDIFMLGPSTPLYSGLISEYRVSKLFGMTFRLFDFEVLGLIGKGMGTQSFSKKSYKVSL